MLSLKVKSTFKMGKLPLIGLEKFKGPVFAFFFFLHCATLCSVVILDPQ